jgi:chemotaxis protein methyltransferase CheR
MVERLSGNSYLQLRDFLSREFGLFFEPSKITFLENRIMPILEEMKVMDINSLIALIQRDPEKRSEFLNTLTTNETWFFRHPRHFDILREEILPGLMREKIKKEKKEIAIWSAGCSIGAEAYSIAITLKEVLQDDPSWKVRIIASDISRKAVTRAQEGVYTQSEVRLLSSMLLTRYFIPLSPSVYKIKPEFHNWLSFEERNLLDVWPDRTFDVVFCRNTMIYFKEETKAALTERLYKVLNPEGVFFTSATEVLHWTGENEFERVFLRGEYIYRKHIRGRAFVLYRFATPADLLRALNLLVKSSIEYQLQSITQLTARSPKKALAVPKHLEKTVEKLLSDVSLKPESREECSQ